MKFLLLIYFLVGPSGAIDYPQFDDSILFSMNWIKHEEIPMDLSLNKDYEVMPMMSPDQEEYTCYIPRQHVEAQDDSTPYVGPSALSLVIPSLKASKCNYFKSHSYWSYKLCHGTTGAVIYQFHQELTNLGEKPTSNYVLGRLSTERVATLELASVSEEDRIPVGRTRVNGDDVPYVAVMYEEGDTCLITAEPRRSRVLYVCQEDGRNELYSVKETSSCVYEIVVLNEGLCSHPNFMKRTPPKNKVHCVSAASLPAKPEELSRLEGHRYNEEKMDLISNFGDKLIDVDDFQELLKKHAATKPEAKKPVQKVEDIEKEFKALKKFLSGEECVHTEGSSGQYWRTKLCYGKDVTQYHEYSTGPPTTVLLGTFDKEKHLEWLQNKETKLASKVRVVEQLYSGGSYCAVISKPRSVQLSFSCPSLMPPEKDVWVMLSEPSPCVYRLVVSGASVCRVIHLADEYGAIDPDTLKAELFPKKEELSKEEEQPVKKRGELLETITEIEQEVDEKESEMDRLEKAIEELQKKVEEQLKSKKDFVRRAKESEEEDKSSSKYIEIFPVDIDSISESNEDESPANYNEKEKIEL